MTGILQKVKDKQEENRNIALEKLRKGMKKDKSKIKGFFWDTYKNLTKSSFDISEPYISSRIRDKWKRVCEYYNKAL